MDADAPPSAAALRLLVALCAALSRDDQVSVREWLAPGGVDWLAFQTAADDHRLTGYLSTRLQAPGLADRVPPDFLAHARRVYLRQWVRNGQLFREMERIAAPLEAAGRPFLFFKGPLLANTLYDQLGSRAVHDIDLLIPEAAPMAAYEPILAALGYRRRSRLLLPPALSRRLLYQLEYQGAQFALEPHWSLHRHPSIALDHERMWRERVLRPTPSGAMIPGLSDEYTLLANLLSIPADLQNASLKLRTMFEIYLLWRRFPATCDWAAFWDRRRAEGTGRLGRIVLAVVCGLFGAAGLEAPAALPLPDSDRPLADVLLAQVTSPATGEWRRRRLAWRLFDAPLSVSLAWWACSLPARALAHPGVTRRRLGRW